MEPGEQIIFYMLSILSLAMVLWLVVWLVKLAACGVLRARVLGHELWYLEGEGSGGVQGI